MLWGADWKFCHEGNCSASRGLPGDAEQLPEWRNFQFAPQSHYGFFFLLHTLLSTIAFRLEYVLFYQFYSKITTFFDQEKFGTPPLLYFDVKTFRGNWREDDIKTSKSSYWRHARESSYTPHVRHFLAPVGFTEIPVGYARNTILKFVTGVPKNYAYTLAKPNKKCKIRRITLYYKNMSHDMTKPTNCAPSENSDQPGHPPRLIRVFAVRSVGS